jgi:hypothetical protein
MNLLQKTEFIHLKKSVLITANLIQQRRQQQQN